MTLILKDDNIRANVVQIVETALTEIRTNQDNLKQSMEVKMQMIKETMEAKMQTMEETTMIEIGTNKEDLKQSMEMMMNAMEQSRMQMDSQVHQMNNKIEIPQSQAMKYNQNDTYVKKKKTDWEKMAEYYEQREKEWKY